MRGDCRMFHAWSASFIQNAKKAHNSIQGHYHSKAAIVYYCDGSLRRWHMTVGCLIDHKAPAFRYAKGDKPIIACGVILSDRGNFLVISDLHIPYQHPDSFEFLSAVRDAYYCEHILCVGDIVDHHAGSYHESEPDALSASDEYILSRQYLKELQGIFPEMVITRGNHDDIPTRKLKTAGLPMEMLSDFNGLYGLDDGWQWVQGEYEFDTQDGVPIIVPMPLKPSGEWNGRL